MPLPGAPPVSVASFYSVAIHIANAQGTDLISAQLELERESISLGAQRYEKMRQSRSEADLAPGRRLILNTVDQTAQRISQWVADADTGRPGKRHTAIKWFRHLDPHGLAYITATCVVAGLTRVRTRASTLASDIGTAVCNEINFAAGTKLDLGVVILHLERHTALARPARHRLVTQN